MKLIVYNQQNYYIRKKLYYENISIRRWTIRF